MALKHAIMTATVAAGAALVGTDCRADDFRHQPDWDSVCRHYKCPDWFGDAKLGIFPHWGPYAVPAVRGEKYPKGIYLEGWRRDTELHPGSTDPTPSIPR